MDDVIFTSNKNWISWSESVYINNEDKVVATDQTQVVLTRHRLSRNKNSDFLINKKQFVWKDITDCDGGLEGV